MRRISESPWLLVGLSLAGATAAVLLDGPRRRSGITRTLTSVAGTVAAAGRDTASGGASLASRVPSWLGLAGLFAPKSTSQRLREALTDALRSRADTRARPSAEARAEHQASAEREVRAEALTKARAEREAPADARAGGDEARRSAARRARWSDAHDEVDDAYGGGHPYLTAGTALLLLGSAAYLLALSPGAEARRNRLGATAKRWIGDVGELARKAGRAVGAGGGKANTKGPHDPSEPMARPTAHPVDLHHRITQAISPVASESSEVTVLIREGVVVVQGTAAPEEYDAIVRAVDSVTHTYVNELQAVSLT